MFHLYVIFTTWNHLKRNARNAASLNHRAKFNIVTVTMFTQDIFARNAVMVIGTDAVLVVIRGIRVTLMRLTTKTIIEHNPRKNILRKHGNCHDVYAGYLLFTIIKKGKTRTCPPLFQFYWKTLISLFYIFINILFTL